MFDPGQHGQGGPQPLGWAEFAVQDVNDDYLVCKAFDGSASYGDNINVAKLPDLRHSLYAGKTLDHGADVGELAYAYTAPQKRTDTKGSVVQTQIVIPVYDTPSAAEDYTGSIILAIPKLTIVKAANGVDDVVCQWCEFSNRAWAFLP